MKPSVTFITRYYPPNPNINGESICDMAHYLQEHFGIESTIVTTDRSFDGGGSNRKPTGRVIFLKTLFKSNHPLFRFFSFLYDGFVLIRYALKFKSSLLVVTTSPPMLPFWASLFYGKKIKWALWAFDLFPEGFGATNMIRENNPFYKWVIRKTYQSNPSRLIALGPRQAGYILNQFKRDIPTSILPCGVFFYQDKSDTPPSWYEADKIIFGYCGNIHDAHNPEFIKSVVDHLDPTKHKIILALYGSKAPALKEYAWNKPGVVLTDHVPRSQLHFIDIHLVSLAVKWTHIAVPSKAVSAITMGCPILFCGSRDSDNWYMFQEAGWFIDESTGIDTQVQDFMACLSRAGIQDKKDKTAGIYEELKDQVLKAYREVAKNVGIM